MEPVKGYETCAQLFLCQNFVPASCFYQPAIAVYLQPTAQSSIFKCQRWQLNRVCRSFYQGNWPSQFPQICHLTWFEIWPVFSHEMCFRTAPGSNWVSQKFDSVWIFFFGRIQNCAFSISRLAVGGAQLLEIFLQLVAITAAAVPNSKITCREEEGRKRKFIIKNSYGESALSALSWS